MKSYQRYLKLVFTLFSVVLVAGCGGGGAGDQTDTKVKFTSIVSFGDSMSDVGSYAVGKVKEQGGGKYTVNSPSTKIWIELIAEQLRQKNPCAAQTGLDGAEAEGFFVMPPADAVDCTAYGQGGSRVTDPVGIGNKLLGGANASMGYLTVPIKTQIEMHLARHENHFSGTELVLMLVGGNDLFINLDNQTPAAAAQAMATAGTELADYINQKITGNGAQYVVVVNLPDVSLTPFSAEKERVAPGSKALINTMVTSFNRALQDGVATNTRVLLVDAYTINRHQYVHPEQYGLKNVVTPVCNLTRLPSAIPLGSSLFCTSNTLISGEMDQYLYADLIHPTPYGHRLLAQLVFTNMAKKGWL